MKIETQKILKPDKVTIICDEREKKIIDLLKRFKHVKLDIMSLPVADFICSDEIGIERKTHSDFVSSIIDGRLFDQASRLSQSFRKPIIIIEGYSFRKINENALIAAETSLITKFNISLITTKNELETSKMIYWLAKKSQEHKADLGIKLNKKHLTTKNIQEMIISSFPGVSIILGRRLLKHFKSLKNIFLANEKELSKVNGIGKKLARNIKKIIEEKYK